jgi:uncharacterized damage-inducible protein DinB
MPISLQEHYAAITAKAVRDLETALNRLPEDKRNWSSMGKARTALDMVAECAVMNDGTVKMLQTHTFPADFDFAAFGQQIKELIAAPDTLRTLLHESTDRVIAAIRAVPDADLSVEIPMPWGPMTVLQIIAYTHWNMTYHEGQINYIASMLGCLD